MRLAIRRTGMITLLAVCVLDGNAIAQHKPPVPAGFKDGFVPTPDGTRLYYVKGGGGPRVVILPARLFAFRDFAWLAEEYTLISYDMRNRGRSELVVDGSRITIEADVRDLETVRRHFGVNRFSVIGYSYLGMMVALYALEHPDRVDRMIQIGPVPPKFGTEYPAHLTAEFQIRPEQRQRLRDLRAKDYHLTHPLEYCEEEWQVTRAQLVGDPAKVTVLESVCAMPNEWPLNLSRHMRHHFQESVLKLDVPRERWAQVRAPVLTIHGTLDRNAPYGAGREWALLLPNARLLTVPNAAHQVFAEFPEIVRPAARDFFAGSWPARAEKITKLDPRSP